MYVCTPRSVTDRIVKRLSHTLQKREKMGHSQKENQKETEKLKKERDELKRVGEKQRKRLKKVMDGMYGVCGNKYFFWYGVCVCVLGVEGWKNVMFKDREG